MTAEEVLDLIKDMESDRIERTISVREDKLGPAVCTFSNDFPNHQQPGFILLGVNDDGSLAGIRWTDENLQKIGNVKTNGNVLPQPSIVISTPFRFPEGEVVVVEVKPSLYPPVRYDGRCWIRLGPRKNKASIEEEKILIERRAAYAKTYDLVPAIGSTLKDLSVDYFKLIYLPLSVDAETLAENGRSTEEQLSALRFFDISKSCPTNAGILIFGTNPLFQLPGAYIQYIKFRGTDMNADVVFEKVFSGPLITELNVIDDFIKNNIIKERPVRTNSFQEKTIRNYPYWPLRELMMNAVMHRNYESNAPVYLYEFADRIEIQNPGGLYGDVNAYNFPNASDYRNVVVAEAMKRLGFVNRFNFGVRRAINELESSGNGKPEFNLSLTTKFIVLVPVNKEW